MTSYYARASHRRRSGGMDWNLSADGLMDVVQRKPEALLLIGAGIALMMRSGGGFRMTRSPSRSQWRNERSDFERRRSGGRPSYQPTGEDGSAWSSDQAESMMSSAGDAMRSASESAGRMASETTEGMTRYASDAMRRVGDTASGYASSASRWAGEAREGLMDRSYRIAERARTLPEELDEAVQDHPIVLAALGVAIGAALGATLPSTSVENRAMGQVSDQLWEAAESASGRLGEAAEEAYEEAFRTAESHGLSKHGLKEMARDVGAKFASAATGDGAAQSSGSPSGTTGGGGRGASSVSTASAPGGTGAMPGAGRDTPNQS